MTYKTEQEEFWANTYAADYIKKNSDFDSLAGQKAWQEMLSKTYSISTILECGCNIGRNIKFLNNILPSAKKSIIELSKPAYDFVINNMEIQNSFNGSIIESELNGHTFDLVFSTGVLIHIHPDNLLDNMQKMFLYLGAKSFK